MVLDAVQLVSDVTSTDIHLQVKTEQLSLKSIRWDKLFNFNLMYLQSSHADDLIGVVEEVGQNVKNGCFRENEFLRTKEKVI